MATAIFNNIVMPYVTLGWAELKAYATPVLRDAFSGSGGFNKEGLASLLFVALVMFLSWLVLFNAVRALYRIVCSLLQVAFYAAILAFLVWVYYRGMEGAYKDLVAVVGHYSQGQREWEAVVQDYTKAHFARSATTVLNHQTIVYPVYATARS